MNPCSQHIPASRISVHNGLNENVPHGLGFQLVALFWEVQVALPCWRKSFIGDKL